jgi:hypothetical protein
MATEHDELENGIAAYVLGSPEAEEHERLRAHIEAPAAAPWQSASRAAWQPYRWSLTPSSRRPGFTGASWPRQLPRVALGAAAALLFAFGALTGVGVARLGPFRQDLQTAERYQLAGSGQVAGVQASAVRLGDAVSRWWSSAASPSRRPAACTSCG